MVLHVLGEDESALPDGGAETHGAEVLALPGGDAPDGGDLDAVGELLVEPRPHGVLVGGSFDEEAPEQAVPGVAAPICDFPHGVEQPRRPAFDVVRLNGHEDVGLRGEVVEVQVGGSEDANDRDAGMVVVPLGLVGRVHQGHLVAL